MLEDEEEELQRLADRSLTWHEPTNERPAIYCSHYKLPLFMTSSLC